MHSFRQQQDSALSPRRFLGLDQWPFTKQRYDAANSAILVFPELYKSEHCYLLRRYVILVCPREWLLSVSQKKIPRSFSSYVVIPGIIQHGVVIIFIYILISS